MKKDLLYFVKKKYTLVIFTLYLQSMCLLFSQSSPPQLISYQGVARDASGNALATKTISIQFIIHQGSATGMSVFTETHTTVTNNFGLFTLQIGSVNTGTFQSIDWSQGPYFLEVQMDPTGGNSFVSIGTQQILSVPYALYSEKSKTAESMPNTGTATAWNTEGNYQTDSTLNFIGTKDNFPLVFRTNNMERMRITKTGKVRIGNTTVPSSVLFSVFGGLNDTVLAHFSNTNNNASLIDIYNLGGYAGVSMRSGTFGQDTGFIGMRNNDGLLIFSTKKINMFNRDSLKVYADNTASLGANHNFNIFTKNDTIKLWGRTLVNYSALNNIVADHAMTINFGNAQSWGAAGLKINHFNASPYSSFGIYINNSASGSGTGVNVGLGTYSIFNYNGLKRGIESYVSGLGGPNIALFLQSDTGSIAIGGYTNWSIYSNGGNVMIRDGHIVSAASTTNTPSLSVTGSVSAYLISTATDTKGYINFNINSTATGTITVTFAKPYSQKPVVVITNTGDADVKLSGVSNFGFTLTVNNPMTYLVSGDINYIVIE